MNEAAAERESCAKLCREIALRYVRIRNFEFAKVADECNIAILKRRESTNAKEPESPPCASS